MTRNRPRASLWGRSPGLVVLLAPALAATSWAQVDPPTVGQLTLLAPAQESFFLHATLPVPPETWPAGSEGSPLTILDWDGTPVRTQAEVVSRYPTDGQGADVLELIAYVHRPTGVVAGAPLVYHVVRAPQGKGLPHLHPAVAELFATPGALSLETADVFEHVYRTSLVEGPELERRRDGALVREWARHRVLLPEVAVGGQEGTLPHMMGVHAYVRCMDEAGYVLIDLHVHNGLDGLDKGTSDDDALVEIYFRHLGLTLPQPWRVLHGFDDPAAVRSAPSGPLVSHYLLAPQDDGTLYLMPKQTHFVRRLAVALPEWEEAARGALESRGLAFARRGLAPGGAALWSWWNPETARYFPQRHLLPDLDHVGLQGVRAGLAAQLAQVEGQIAAGTAGGYPFLSPRLGWAHPWGVPYGGMTGVDEIQMVSGLRTVTAAAREGYRLAQAQMRAYADRQPTALYSLSGRPTQVEDILVDGPYGPYVTSTFFLLPGVGDPFGFGAAPTFQTEAVAARELEPRWAWALEHYAPIDLQHYVRYTRNLKVLTWLGNDSLARAELEAAAEIFHLSYHPFPFSQWGYVEGTGLLAKMKVAAEHPGQGLPIGRGDAWGLDAVAAAYSTGSQAFRDRSYPWIEGVLRTYSAGQSTCTGNLMSLYVGKLLGGRFRVRRSNEMAYLENALTGVRESLFLGRDEAVADLLRDMIVSSVRAGTTPPYWSEDGGGPWTTVGVAPADLIYDEFCRDVPPSGFEAYIDKVHPWSSLAYAYELSGNRAFLDRAQDLAGSVPLVDFLMGDGLQWIEERSPLLALLQALQDQR